MCGFAGKLASSPQSSIDPGLLEAMAESLSHRGPDADGFYFGSGVGLAHRRLSIVDVAAGHQPLANEDGSVWVVFNGEIYNFADLRADLEARGHVFRTHSDTEVIAHGYEEWGESCVEHFRGMFAFALWDVAARRLLLARDRVGIKPVYYARTADGGVTFASEIKAILQDSSVDTAWSAEALDAYLTFLYVPGPATIYRDIHKLPAGHVLVAENGNIRISRYWDLEFTGDGNVNAEDAVPGGVGRAADRVGAHAPDQRGSTRRVPVRRDRLCNGRGLHGQNERRPSPHFLRGFLGPRVQ